MLYQAIVVTYPHPRPRLDKIAFIAQERLGTRDHVLRSYVIDPRIMQQVTKPINRMRMASPQFDAIFPQQLRISPNICRVNVVRRDLKTSTFPVPHVTARSIQYSAANIKEWFAQPIPRPRTSPT